MQPEIVIVMPVFNEQASVRKVVLEWFQEVENWTEKFLLLAVNDGSTDETQKVLARLKAQLGTRLEIISRANKGHGQSCLDGYRFALSRNAKWILQIDSDGQCDPQYFFRFWRSRESFDIIYGHRVIREDGWRRVAASWFLRITLLFFCRTWCIDANVPYRLMSSKAVKKHLSKIPPYFSLANVALAVLLKKDKTIHLAHVPIRFRERYGGEPSVQLTAFGSKAIELVIQLRRMIRKTRSDCHEQSGNKK